MLKSLYSGISGLKNHQTRMDVVGNNISNVNTTGFKSGRVNFQDALSQYYSNNPAIGQNQVGTGMKVASINNDFTQGPMQSTGRTLDLAIQGNGFFGLKPGATSDSTSMRYTRDGVFFLMEDPGSPGTYNVVNSDGMLLCGTGGQPIKIEIDKAYYSGTASSAAQIKVSSAQGSVTEAQGYVNAYKPLASDAEKALDDKIAALDTASSDLNKVLTNYISLKTDYEKKQTEVDKCKKVLDDLLASGADPAGSDVIAAQDALSAAETARNTAKTLYDDYTDIPKYEGLKKDYEDSEAAVKQCQDDLAAIDPILDPTGHAAAQAALAAAETARDTAKTDYDDYKANSYAGPKYEYDLAKASYDKAKDEYDVAMKNLNNAEVSLKKAQLAYDTAKSEESAINGQKTINTIAVDSLGNISGVDSLGRSVKVSNGQVALYSFKSNDGLKKEGGNLFSATGASGEAEEGTASAANNNTINSGYLEGSNVNLSQEMVDMMVTQRGFQANARTITVSDTLLEELVNLKR
ncbi:flagellar hook-basal body complex protein [Desulforamulus aeronauticus]|uniref:Flagellar hook protein FlgE n=1 Tax=Desulforamulus aeronauticus DSM 10349 TaxID=1121421 RepID=A0A1M6RCI8_9FIRM|nr:flagellar hook-basal body complex protein [Desulforamulus aeronauticus]SHK30146.1 flagellar hook protein FlgE [Desulforamulus aeronauticus DSM 10349]